MQPTLPYTTLTHEVGHWLGLYHTFEAPAGKDPCLEPNDPTHGDRLVDTPRWSDKGPESSRDCYDWTQVKPACSGKYSLADIKKSVGNFLSYSYFACRKSFTTGQLNKMYQTATLIRKFKPTCAKLS
ncbi:hypothetical protein BCR35DRAFT_5213 [Leucosporidium creatinivorum]|uniref:Peptidase M43 pregnancy-associated plasma-A domain-containing protein n=1 Tax=Leucosporidium creatinivorum TaxID=106004 RepID=A0A1Y2G7U7_9BASI|nr:hypothetical protein BCR35DRAFT_5213 [Leucosporidium creatinivorum]